MEMKVGQQIFHCLKELNQLVSEIGEETDISYCNVVIGNRKSWTFYNKEQGNQVVQLLVDAGFEVEKTKIDEIKNEHTLFIPDTKVRITVQVKTDKVEGLQAEVEKAKNLYEDALKKLELETKKEVSA